MTTVEHLNAGVRRLIKLDKLAVRSMGQIVDALSADGQTDREKLAGVALVVKSALECRQRIDAEFSVEEE